MRERVCGSVMLLQNIYTHHLVEDVVNFSGPSQMSDTNEKTRHKKVDRKEKIQKMNDTITVGGKQR